MASSMRAIPNRTALHFDYYTTAKKSALRLNEAFMGKRNRRARIIVPRQQDRDA
jgi:hypothetical protein